MNELLNEEESDYYRDYKHGLISYQEYQDLVKQFQQREKERGWERRAHDRGPWYLEIDGKIYKQKGVPKAFDWESGARKYALAIMKNRPDLHSKIALTKRLPPGEQGVAETSYVNGKIEDPKSLRWKQTSLSYEEAVKKYGKDKVKDEGKNRHGHSIIYVHVPLGESASVGSTSAGNIASVEGGAAAYSKGPVKSVNALDQDQVSLFGGPMEDIKTKPRKKVAIIKRR